MFEPLLFNLRSQGVKIGMQEWLRFVEGLRLGLATDLDGLYRFGRAILVHSETQYDAFDVAFAATFEGLELKPELKKALEDWLSNPAMFDEMREAGQHDFESLEELMEAMRKTLEEQRERHEGGNRWVGTGGTSPFGNSGKANMGVRVGGSGGGRSAVRLAEERRWHNYRTDLTLGVRDFKVALRALKHLAREGTEVLDIDETIDSTAKNCGDIDLVFNKDRKNRVRVTLLMDAGGSMTPHNRLVSQLFTAGKETKTFKTFDHFYFHNCVYQSLYRDYENYDRLPTAQVLRDLTPEHRLIFVGDASMASWELFSAGYAFADEQRSGLEWLQAFSHKCAAAVWLNPDPERFWNHPTVRAIGDQFRMYPLTLDGLRKAVQFLRVPR